VLASPGGGWYAPAAGLEATGLTATAGQAERTGAGAESAAPILELRGIGKAFPGVRALADVSLSLAEGEVHMLLGENGAGKSTLMKILYGAYQADEGEIRHRGRIVAITSPAAARALGIAVIFQEFSLVPFLSVAENIFLGREFRRGLPGQVDRRRALAEAKRLLVALDPGLDPATPVDRLGVAQQQVVEIAKALSQEARILVMDEPTAALSERECARLFAIIRDLRAKGVAIVYITHRLQEVFELGDRITVLRDGRHVATLRPGETDPDALVRLMIGRPLAAAFRREVQAAPGKVALEVKGLASPSGLHGIDLVVREGEIVGLAGLVGAGRTELARCIFGADPYTAGEVRIDGEALKGGPDALRRRGLGLIPESRKQEGLALVRSVQDNLLMAGLWKLFPSGWFSPRAGRATAARMVERLRIATPSLGRPARFLSGGNQQKIVIGKWVAAGCRLFLFDEPTRGIDVGAKAEIFRLIEDLVRQGAAVLMIDSEFEEIVQVCDRAYVMRDGTIAGHLERGELSEENILRQAMPHG
jgi:ribose transport system ATP-binding protein